MACSTIRRDAGSEPRTMRWRSIWPTASSTSSSWRTRCGQASRLSIFRQLRAMNELFAGDFAEGLQIDRNPQFASWLSAQRRRFRLMHVTVLEQLVRPTRRRRIRRTLEHLEKWLQLNPFDQRAHELLLRALLRRGRIRRSGGAPRRDHSTLRDRRTGLVADPRVLARSPCASAEARVDSARQLA